MVAVNNRRVNRWVRAAPITCAAVACLLLLFHAWLALGSGHGVNHVSGVWLTLARDAREGVFYRALNGSGEYGGTRYFPLLFLLIATFMRTGIPAIIAGQVASLIGAAVLVTGATALLRGLGQEKWRSLVGGVLVIASYFVQQTIFAIRVEPLAAGLALWGAAFVARRHRDAASPSWAWCAAACFGLAVAAKPTAAYAGVASVLALALLHRRADAIRLSLLCVVFWTAVVVAIGVSSNGRAIESFRACAFAGGSALDILRPSALTETLGRLMVSRLLAAMLILCVAALALAPRRWRALPTLLLCGAFAASAAALGTEGTIVTNQSVEPYVAAAVFLTWMSGELAFGRAAAAVLTALLIWASAQTAREIRSLVEMDALALPRERSAVTEEVRRCEGPILAESPLVPILAGRRVILLDPFAFRVAAFKHPDLSRDLVGRLERREFGCVVLDHDPESAAGRGWYRNVHLGSDVIEAVMMNYTLRDLVGDYRFYGPAASSGRHLTR
jgi:hypothetical protein